MSNQSHPLTALPTPVRLRRDTRPDRQPLNRLLIGVWTIGVVVSLAAWAGIAVAIMAFVG